MSASLFCKMGVGQIIALDGNEMARETILGSILSLFVLIIIFSAFASVPVLQPYFSQILSTMAGIIVLIFFAVIVSIILYVLSRFFE